MTDYVYDDTALPDGKTDLVPLTGTPSKHVTAAEWNTVMAAIGDLQNAILGGQYHGLASTPTAAVSSATGVRLRSNAGVLEVSEAGAAYAPITVAPSPGEIYVSESPYNAVGDGVTDDTVALQAAFDAAEDGTRIILESGKTYLTSDTLRFGTGTGAIIYLEGRGATIQRGGSALTDWAPNTAYVAGNRRLRGAVAYECTTGGTSTNDAALGPGGYGTGISDNTPWIAETSYTIGQQRSNGGKLYIVTTAGDSATSGGPTGTGTGIADGTVVWDYVSAVTSAVVWKSISDAVLEVISNQAVIKELLLGAGRVASYGLWIESASRSLFENLDSYQALFDGYKLFSDSDFVVMLNCQARISGRMWQTSGYGGSATAQLKTTATGTFAKTSGTNAVLTYTSSGGSPIVDLRTIGLRVGDFISLDATTPGDTSAEWLQINTIDSATQITCTQHPASSGAASGLLFSIHRGDGFHTGPGRAENNCHTFNTCRSDNSAGAGFRIGGLYGPRCTNLLVNAANSHPVVIATSSLPCIGTSIQGLYTEVGLNGASNNVYCGGAAGLTLDTVNGDGLPGYSSSSFNWGTVTNMQNSSDPGRIDPVSPTTINWVPCAVMGIANPAPGSEARFQGPVASRSYGSYSANGEGLFEMNDHNLNLAPVEIKSGVSSYLTDAGFAAFSFNTSAAITNRDTGGVNENNLLLKHLHRWLNNGSFKFGIGVYGDLRTISTDDSGTPGAATNDKPSGRFAMAAGATTVTITNKLCVASTKVFLSKRTNDATAVDFKVVSTTGSFTVTAAAATTAAVTFDYFLVNVSSS